MNCQEDFAAFISFYGIKLNNRSIGESFQIFLEIVKGSSYPTELVNLKWVSLLPQSESDLSGQINVSGGKKSGIYQAVNGTLTHHDGVRIRHIDMMRRMTVLNQGRNDKIQCMELFLGI
jgi:hypothetical protein